MNKPASTGHPVHDLISARWSPYWFSQRSINASDLHSILEAARWAPSSYNEQPWAFIVATRAQADEHARLVSCLIEGNRTWAQEAPVLMLGLVRRQFQGNGKDNVACEHDLGLAAATLTFEASARGISVHQMSGIEHQRIRSEYQLPEEVSPLTALALGYCATPDDVPQRYQERQQRERSRAPLSSFVFGGKWGEPTSLV